MVENTIQIKFPNELLLTNKAFHIMQSLNPGVILKEGDENDIFINKKEFLFDDIDFFELILPEHLDISWEHFEEFCELNELYKIERNENGIILINMLTPQIITAFTLLIATSIVI
jgi:hypothetical protein